MQDAITTILNRYDLTGKYLDKIAIEELNNYFVSGLSRIKATEVINCQAPKIIKEAAARLYEEQPELLRPGGNSYTTRRYAACLRDIEYYLRYASYALIAGDINILNERVLDGLRDVYNSLSVPIAPTIRSIKLLEEVLKQELKLNGIYESDLITEPFQYMISGLSEQDI
uniref:Allophycocyanin beta 18 subunit n=2 Tax=Gracilariopsis TaxID=2781 RepID=A0A1C9CEW9_9FLOR|nr:allophycocyanin beta 18 chain [Gracilariopsis lemaneiformis]YP_009294671.1 allophycocyanin beta 18 subunit [Gracilariopsis chorda]AJO68502.1 allophycocyanin beta 18 subunit [Gracilariopsis lemaneiformis]AML79777.1 allophycocyanin beta 18 chain [Gracilariopsis lemaneiformis]AOM66931.1 allophycocyanin beta 18 subunit [Gracilariopsis chorda]UAD88807.1 allophycocyanin beta 18 subunit [Gracilariopsis chorda]